MDTDRLFEYLLKCPKCRKEPEYAQGQIYCQDHFHFYYKSTQPELYLLQDNLDYEKFIVNNWEFDALIKEIEHWARYCESCEQVLFWGKCLNCD